MDSLDVKVKIRFFYANSEIKSTHELPLSYKVKDLKEFLLHNWPDGVPSSSSTEMRLICNGVHLDHSNAALKDYGFAPNMDPLPVVHVVPKRPHSFADSQISSASCSECIIL